MADDEVTPRLAAWEAHIDECEICLDAILDEDEWNDGCSEGEELWRAWLNTI